MQGILKFLPITLAACAAFFLAIPAPASEVGKSAPDFTLTDTYGKQHRLSDYRGKVVVLEWINHGCPWVVHHYEMGNMQDLQKTYAEKDVVWFSISTGRKGAQGVYTPEKANEVTKKYGAKPAAYLFDPDGNVGRLYGARTTPQMYVIDASGVLLYNGGIDDKQTRDPAETKRARNHLAAALDEVLAGRPVSVATSRPYGCTVKY